MLKVDWCDASSIYQQPYTTRSNTQELGAGRDVCISIEESLLVDPETPGPA